MCCAGKKQKTISYKTIRNLISPDKNAHFDFDYIRGKKKTGEDQEKNAFCNLKFYHAIKDAYKNHPNEWIKLQDNIDLFDQIGEILTKNKDDEALESELNKLSLPNDVIKEFMALSFSGFGHLSLKALRKITPHLLEGMTYDQAVEASYPGQFAQKLSGDKSELPRYLKTSFISSPTQLLNEPFHKLAKLLTPLSRNMARHIKSKLKPQPISRKTSKIARRL